MQKRYGKNAKKPHIRWFVKHTSGNEPARKADTSPLATFTRWHPVPESNFIRSSSSGSTETAETEVTGTCYSSERPIPITDTTTRLFRIKNTRLYG